MAAGGAVCCCLMGSWGSDDVSCHASSALLKNLGDADTASSYDMSIPLSVACGFLYMVADFGQK